MPSPGESNNLRGKEREKALIVRQCNKSYEHHELLANAMSVDYTGQWVLLAGREYLALRRLGQDDDKPRQFARNSKYEVSAAEFAILPNRQEFCAIATSEHIDIVTWGAGDPRHFHSLRGHTRTVTDIDWHSKDGNLLVSCSIDTFSHIWDLRDPRKPSLSLSAVCMSGATQVGFNRVSGHLLAAAHDGDLRIWDIRKGSCPVHYITAHLNRVHGINWSHRRETCLATASQDGTVKYFDVDNPRRAEKIITTSSPVWRARYTPIGNGLVSIVLPQLGRGENSLLLWSNSKQTDPVCSFAGHTDVILDFAWRPNRENTSEIEFVTWSRDRSLRVWKIDDMMLKLCEPDSDTYDTYDIPEAETPTKFYHIPTTTSAHAPPPTVLYHRPAASLPTSCNALQIPSTSRSPPPPLRKEDTHIARSLTDQPTCSLHHEFSLLNTNIPHVEVDVLDAIKRYALFRISAGGHVAVLQTNFPTDYPSPNIGPEFNFCPGTTLHEHLSTALLKTLKNNALQRVKKSRTCLEQCLRALVTAMKKSVGGSDKTQLRLQSPRLEGALSGALHDACIPYPRSSGAKFNPIGILITFAQIPNTKRLTLRHQNATPRTLSAISSGGLLGNVLYAHRDSNASIYLQDRMTSKHSKHRPLQKSTNATPIVHIYEASRLLNINREMAMEFSLDKRDLIATCRQNKQVCENHGRYDLVPIWKLAELIATPNIPNESRYEMLFYKDPFKKFLLEALIMHFASVGDLQTAVMLACLFHKCPSAGDMDGFTMTAAATAAAQIQQQLSSSNTSPYHTVLPIDYQSSHAKANASNAGSVHLKQLRSNSWSDSLDWLDAKLFNTDSYSCSLIRRTKMPLFDHFKKVYADILFGWQLLDKRALILKHTMYSETLPSGVEFMAECCGCKKLKRTPACKTCQRPVIFCQLCGLPVKGAVNACVMCGHGGHTAHMLQWFEKHDVCASGCGCHCLKETSVILECIN